MKKVLAVFAILVLVPVAYGAGEPMAFLGLGTGVRATGMGGAYTAVPGDAAGAFYNPAGISSVRSLQFTAETYLMTFGRSVNYISTCKAFDMSGHYYAAGLSWFNYSAGGDIEARSTNSPEPERKFSDNSHLFILTAATDISDRLSFGINAKLDLRVIDDVKGTGFGFDAGVLLKIAQGLYIGVNASNIRADIWWDNKDYKESAPASYSAGLSYSIADIFGAQGFGALVSADGVFNTFGFMKIKCGVELKANDFFFLRAGFNGAFSAGCGAVFKLSEAFSLKIDYAFSSDAVTETFLNHRVGISMDFNPEDKSKSAAVTEQKAKEADDEEKPW